MGNKDKPIWVKAFMQHPCTGGSFDIMIEDTSGRPRFINIGYTQIQRPEEPKEEPKDSEVSTMSNPTSPNHYKTGGIECWDAMEQVYGIQETMIFCKLNAFKYLWRCDRKNGTEDIKKAKTYLEKYLELEYKLYSKGE